MNKRFDVVVFFDGNLISLPPLISLLRILADLKLICLFVGRKYFLCNGEIVTGIGIDYETVDFYGKDWEQSISCIHHPLQRIKYSLTKKSVFRQYRKSVWQIINDCLAKNPNLLLWTVYSSSAGVLGDEAVKLGKRHIHTFYELGEECGRGIDGFDIDKLYHSATIVECEPNRAEILAANYDLQQVPFVIPNCPYGHPRQRNLPVENFDAAKVVAGWKDRFVFLYQGVLEVDRAGIVDVLECLCKNFPEDVIAIMTWQNNIDCSRLAKYKNFQRVPFIPAPMHLQVTSHASVGIAYYSRQRSANYSALNAVYCAPNKIYEYTGFGIPVLCNDLPGLRYTIGTSGAGVCWCDDNDNAVVEAALHLKNEYQKMSIASNRFFDSVDLKACVERVLNYASSSGGIAPQN